MTQQMQILASAGILTALFIFTRRPAAIAGAVPGMGASTIPPGAPPNVTRWRDAAVKAGSEFGISPQLILAIIWQESTGVPSARGKAGEVGLMQITEIAARDSGFNGTTWDPQANIWIGTAYLATLRDRYGASSALGMARGYNGGPAAIGGSKPAANKYAIEVLQKAGWT